MSTSPRFRQQITPERRGRIRYLIKAWAGEPFRVGRRVSEHFAVAPNQFLGQCYTFTHLPTGLAVPYLYPRTLREAKELAQRFERTADCSVDLAAKRQKRESEKLKAEVLAIRDRERTGKRR